MTKYIIFEELKCHICGTRIENTEKHRLLEDDQYYCDECWEKH